MRIAVLHPQAAFVRGGAEAHAEALVRALQDAGHEADLVTIAWQWFPPVRLAHNMAIWRSFDISESNGLKVDAVIALKFPAYLVHHDRKIVWLIHQHRTAYDLWDHPEYADLSRIREGPAIREMIVNADRLGLDESSRIFTNSANVKRRLWESLRIEGDVLYHPSDPTMTLLDEAPGPYGDHVFLPGRFEPVKRQALAIEAMRQVRSPLTLVLVGRGPDEPLLRELIDRHGVGDRVRLEIGVTDDRLQELYLTALAVLYPPFDEDYGYVTIEGMAAERPVVTCTDSGGPLEFVAHEQTGLVTEPDASAVAAALDRLHGDRVLAARIGAAGRERVREMVPAWPQIVERLLGP
ncbi:MAG: glycosyltransferase family 4 protein [Actinomycetota bacterium]